MYDRAVRSREIWAAVAPKAEFWHEAAGSLHLAYQPDEWQVLQELHAVFEREGRPVSLLDKDAGVGGAGMTLSFGLAEELMAGL